VRDPAELKKKGKAGRRTRKGGGTGGKAREYKAASTGNVVSEYTHSSHGANSRRSQVRPVTDPIVLDACSCMYEGVVTSLVAS
jgi:hypothetical protein